MHAGRFFSVAVISLVVFGGEALAAGDALPGRWTVNEIDRKEKIVYALALPYEPSDVRPEDIEPTLQRAFDAVKKKHPEYQRFVIYLLKDEGGSHTFGRLVADGGHTEVASGDFGEGSGSKTIFVVLFMLSIAVITVIIVYIRRHRKPV